ncbi:MAG: MASE1 domain-containing protein [Kofleriaceae bacterium]|nr:MASE1 domain-containing protein [Kofleriaceae bacterium]
MRLALVFVSALAIHRIGLLFYDTALGVSAVWPGSGVWLAMVLLSPKQLRTATILTILSVSLIADWYLAGRLDVTLGYVTSNALEVTLGAWAMERLRGPRPTFTRAADILALIFVTTIVNAVSTLPGAWAGTRYGTADLWSSYATWWTSDALGILLVTPLVVSWMQHGVTIRTKRRLVEVIVFGIVWCLAAWLTFKPSEGGASAPYSYVLVCLLAWASLRHGIRVVSTAIAVLGAIALHASIVDPSTDVEHLTQTQLYLGIAAITGFLLSATTNERRTAEAAASQAEERLKLAIHSARMGAWIWDIASRRVRWSEEVEAIFGVAPGTFDDSYDGYVALIHPDDRELVASTIRGVLESKDDHYAVEHRVIGNDGAERWIESVGRVFRDLDGRATRVAGTVVDITRRKQSEEQLRQAIAKQQKAEELLRQAQKMEAIGQLAGGVAHDFNNILAAIMMNAGAVNRETLPADVAEALSEILSASQRAANLTRQLLAVSRRQVLQRRLVDLNGVVAELGNMLGRIVGAHVTLRVEQHPAPLVVNVDPGMIEQVVMNLVVNARDAMPTGGQLVIRTGTADIDETAARSVPELVAGRYVSLQVSDTGIGVPPANLEHIFEPFFTTKPLGQGTGLGLATVFGIVKQHRGHIRVESELDRGSMFEVLLPASPEPAVAIASEPSTLPRGGTETILVVEDDPALRRATCATLRQHGYRVLEAATGAEAMQLFDTTTESIQLLLTDLVMPGGIDGFTLAANLVGRRPNLRVIFTSGYSAELAGRDLELVHGHNFLQKPSSPETMLETIRNSLDVRECGGVKEGRLAEAATAR